MASHYHGAKPFSNATIISRTTALATVNMHCAVGNILRIFLFLIAAKCLPSPVEIVNHVLTRSHPGALLPAFTVLFNRFTALATRRLKSHVSRRQREKNGVNFVEKSIFGHTSEPARAAFPSSSRCSRSIGGHCTRHVHSPLCFPLPILARELNLQNMHRHKKWKVNSWKNYKDFSAIQQRKISQGQRSISKPEWQNENSHVIICGPVHDMVSREKRRVAVTYARSCENPRYVKQNVKNAAIYIY